SEDDEDQQPLVDKAQEKGKATEVPDVPLLADTPYQRQMRQRVIINLKPIIERLDAQGEIMCSLQSDVNSIFMSQASVTKEISQAVGAQAPPPPPPAAQRSEEDIPRPSGPDVQVAGPSGPAAASSQAEVSGSGPPGPVEQVQGPVEKVSGPLGLLESESVQQVAEETEAVDPEPPAPSSTQTPVPPSPPSSSTAPPAPQTFNKPQPRTISSPTPFPSQSTSSPASSTPISPPPPVFEVPPDSSSAGASSSSGLPSLEPSDIPPPTSHSLLHPSPPPSFITIIPEGAQLESPYLGKVKDEFEEVILRSVLKKKIKMARHFQLFNNYRYVHRLPEVQFSQFKQAINALGLADAHTEAVQVDFATLQVPEEILLPPIQSLVMESSIGSIIFERFARVMGRIKWVAKTWTPTSRPLIGVHIPGRQGHVGGHPLDANPLLAARPLTSTVQLTTTDVDVNILLRNCSRYVNARVGGSICCSQVLQLTARDAATMAARGRRSAQSRSLEEDLGMANRQESRVESYQGENEAQKEGVPKPFQRQDRKKKKLMEGQQSTMASGSEKPECIHCGKRHGGNACWRKEGRCLRCGSKDHRLRECPNLKTKFISRDVSSTAIKEQGLSGDDLGDITT
ncbi:hypothetical protein Taro_038955, partial [Colocasia esculenta]|nr:hypothetical protein [Colocasia esculenta]